MPIRFRLLCFILVMWVSSACSATAVQIIPTDLPTATATYTPSPTHTPARDVTPTRRPTDTVPLSIGGSTPTPLLGATRTSAPNEPTETRIPNPNAARIEFFTSDVLAVEPGGSVTLFWSARNVDAAVIYRLNPDETRQQVWNVPPDSSLNIQTRRSDRGQLTFLLTVGESETYNESRLIIPIRCPIEWFFTPPPTECPAIEAVESTFLDQSFERGRMVYIAERNQTYVLFNDGNDPSWLSFNSLYDPEIHPESEPNFVPPAGFFQPLRELGFLWRSNDTVRNRLGLGTTEAKTYQGFYQTAPSTNEREDLFLTAGDNTIINIIPGGTLWQFISP